MKFQLIATAAALFVASVAALPAAQTDNHGLIPDTDDFVDDGDAFSVVKARDVTEADIANFTFTPDFDFSLDRLLSEIEEIPDEVLEKGDEALHKWLVDHGRRPGNEPLKRDEDSGAPAETEIDARGLSLIERGELVVRASWWKTAKCIAAIIKLLATTAVPASKLLRIKKYIKALGGTKKAVKLLLKATSKAERLRIGGKALVNLASELLGISSVKKNCF
ncbi:hypothetical protein VTI74DRAFT_2254 [Chaetomium olivicolor]